jgi:hypothetical protein
MTLHLLKDYYPSSKDVFCSNHEIALMHFLIMLSPAGFHLVLEGVVVHQLLKETNAWVAHF